MQKNKCALRQKRFSGEAGPQVFRLFILVQRFECWQLLIDWFQFLIESNRNSFGEDPISN